MKVYTVGLHDGIDRIFSSCEEAIKWANENRGTRIENGYRNQLQTAFYIEEFELDGGRTETPGISIYRR